MVDDSLHDKIEQYLLGQLSPDESARLEADMAADPALAEQVALQRLGLMGMQRLAAAGMRAKFDEWDADLDVPPPTTSPPHAEPASARNPWIGSTIALLLLLTAGALWHFGQINKERGEREQERRQIAFRDSMIAVLQADYRARAAELEALMRAKPGSDSLALLEIKRLRDELERKDKALRELEQRRPAGNKQVAMRLAPPPTRLRGSGDDDPILGAARQAYEKPDYDEAVRLLKSIPPGDPRQAQVTQMLPYALFYAGRFQESIPAFVNLWEQDEDNEAMNAQGYLLLCYIAEGKMAEARQIRLVILKYPRHKFYKTAIEAEKEIR